MSVSALISRFSSLTDSPPPSPGINPRNSGVSRRHYSTGSAGSSRSESPASSGTHSPHLDNSGTPTRHMSAGNGSGDVGNSRARVLASITEDKIRMFNSRCEDSNKDTTDGLPPGSTPKAIASRQMSTGCVIGREGDTALKVPARRQLSAPGLGSRGRSPSPFRLPGMASCKCRKEKS